MTRHDRPDSARGHWWSAWQTSCSLIPQLPPPTCSLCSLEPVESVPPVISCHVTPLMGLGHPPCLSQYLLLSTLSFIVSLNWRRRRAIFLLPVKGYPQFSPTNKRENRKQSFLQKERSLNDWIKTSIIFFSEASKWRWKLKEKLLVWLNDPVIFARLCTTDFTDCWLQTSRMLKLEAMQI